MFPKLLNREDIFPTPLWSCDYTDQLNYINKVCDVHIKQAKKNMQKQLKERNKFYNTKNDHGLVYHSNLLSTDNKLKDFNNYIVATCHNLLNEMGFDLTNYKVHLDEIWVQEFAKSGGGHHTLHTHWNGHISGFYFLKASDKTSKPVFTDPRSGAEMNLLPNKSNGEIVYGTPQIEYTVKSGRMMFFPSYIPHLYTVDEGVEPFRFIHWNCRAYPKNI